MQKSFMKVLAQWHAYSGQWSYLHFRALNYVFSYVSIDHTQFRCNRPVCTQNNARLPTTWGKIQRSYHIMMDIFNNIKSFHILQEPMPTFMFALMSWKLWRLQRCCCFFGNHTENFPISKESPNYGHGQQFWQTETFFPIHKQVTMDR